MSSFLLVPKLPQAATIAHAKAIVETRFEKLKSPIGYAAFYPASRSSNTFTVSDTSSEFGSNPRRYRQRELQRLIEVNEIADMNMRLVHGFFGTPLLSRVIRQSPILIF